jgi:16S rRNA G966 N2-methylase RsmD
LCGIDAGYQVERGPVTTTLRHLPAGLSFDVIVLDPPYDAPDLSEALDAAAVRLTNGGLLVLERATRREPETPRSLSRTRDVKSGDSTLTFYTMSS